MLATVCPQLPAHIERMKRQNKISFPMLHDAGNSVAESYGLRHGFPDDLEEIYSSFGIDLESYNGDDSWTLPVPARLIIDQSGTVRHIDADPDYTKRPEPADTLGTLRALQ